MIEEIRFKGAYPDIEGTDAAVHLGFLYLNQDELGGVRLSPRTIRLVGVPLHEALRPLPGNPSLSWSG